MTEYQRALGTIAESDIAWIDEIFQWCVVALVDLAEFLGISYEEINVWLFVILMPTFMVGSLMTNLVLIHRLSKCNS